MASNRIDRVGPIALVTTLTTNVFNCNVTSLAGPINFTLTQPVVFIRFVRIVNKTATPATFSFWLGASGGNVAGTEVIGQGFSVPGNFTFQTSQNLRMNAADFLVGGAGTTLSLTLELEIEVGFS